MAEQQWRPKANPWAIAISVTMVAFMEVLDTTIVNVALPHIAGSMSAGQDEATWTLTSYLVANGIVLPISGFFSRLLGRKRYFLTCIAMFTLCSLMCGLSTSLPEIVIFRLLQGFFGGGLQPNQQSIILDTFEPSQRGRAFGVVALATIVAPVLGPALGGWITDNYSWRWIFFINVPVGILTFFAVMHLVEDPPWLKREADKKISVDYIGLSLIAIGLGCMQIVLDRGEDDDWFTSPFIRLFAVLAAMGISGAIAWLLYAKNPVVNLRVMKDRNFALGCLSIFCMASILYSSAVLLPQLAQQQLGYNATWAGFILSPGAFLIIFMIPIITKLMPHIQTRLFIACGFFVLGLALLYAHTLNSQVDFRTLALMRTAQTFGIAFLFVPISTIAYSTIPKNLNSDATSLFTMFRNVAGSIGISVASAMIISRTQIRMAHLGQYMTPLYQPFNDAIAQIKGALITEGNSPDLAQGIMYRNLITQSSILAYGDVFALCAFLAFAVVPIAFLFSAKKGKGGGGGH